MEQESSADEGMRTQPTAPVTTPIPNPVSPQESPQAQIPTPLQEKKKTFAPKQIIIGIVAVIAVLVFLFGTHTICFHNWNVANCSHPKTCYKCGKTEGDIASDAHGWNDAICCKPKNCGYCGLTEGEPNYDHHYWEDATCLAPMTCSWCGEQKGDKIAHKYEDGICATCGISEKAEDNSSNINSSSQSSNKSSSSSNKTFSSSTISASDEIIGSWHGIGIDSGEGLDYSEYVDKYSNINAEFESDGSMTLEFDDSNYSGSWSVVTDEDGTRAYRIDMGSEGVWAGVVKYSSDLGTDLLAIVAASNSDYKIGFVKID